MNSVYSASFQSRPSDFAEHRGTGHGKVLRVTLVPSSRTLVIIKQSPSVGMKVRGTQPLRLARGSSLEH